MKIKNHSRLRLWLLLIFNVNQFIVIDFYWLLFMLLIIEFDWMVSSGFCDPVQMLQHFKKQLQYWIGSFRRLCGLIREIPCQLTSILFDDRRFWLRVHLGFTSSTKFLKSDIFLQAKDLRLLITHVPPKLHVTTRKSFACSMEHSRIMVYEVLTP